MKYFARYKAAAGLAAVALIAAACGGNSGATEGGSAAGECTSSTSASPRRPISIACPLPTATGFTAQPAVANGASDLFVEIFDEVCPDEVEAL